MELHLNVAGSRQAVVWSLGARQVEGRPVRGAAALLMEQIIFLFRFAVVLPESNERQAN